MLTKKLAAMLLAAVMIFSAATPAFAEDSNKKVIRVVGIGGGPKGGNLNGSFYKSFARQAAKMDALRKLAEIIDGVTVETKVTVDKNGNGDEVIIIKCGDSVTKEKIMQQISKTTRLIDVKFYDDACEVTMEMPLVIIK